jgi:hypothetical protein
MDLLELLGNAVSDGATGLIENAGPGINSRYSWIIELIGLLVFFPMTLGAIFAGGSFSAIILTSTATLILIALLLHRVLRRSGTSTDST